MNHNDNYPLQYRNEREDLISIISHYLVLNGYYSSRNHHLFETLDKLRFSRTMNELKMYVNILKREFIKTFENNPIDIRYNEY